MYIFAFLTIEGVHKLQSAKMSKYYFRSLKLSVIMPLQD